MPGGKIYLVKPGTKQKDTLRKRVERVERTLRQGREHKVARISGEKNLSNEIATSNLIDFFPEIPVEVGAEGGGRIGLEIRLKKVILKTWIQYAPLDANNRVARDQANVMARHIIFKQRDQQSANGLLAAGIFVEDEFLESGGFTSANEFRNIMSPINRDLFSVKSDKKLKITNAVDTTDANSDADANPHNFKIANKTMRFGKGPGKKLTFAKDEGTVKPVQFPWVLAAGYCNTNGTVATANAARIFYDCTVYYTDS